MQTLSKKTKVDRSQLNHSAAHQTRNHNFSSHMAYPRDQKSIREVYEERFSAMDSREVTVHRVVNIVDKRSPMPRQQVGYDRSFDNDQWYCSPRNYHDARESYGDDGFLPNDRRYFDDSPPCNFRRNISQNEGPASQQWYGRDDLRHQLGSRNGGGSGPHFRSRSRGRVSGPPRRSPPPAALKRGRSPVRRSARPPAPVRSGSNTSNRSFSPDREKGFPHQPAQQQQQQQQRRHLPSVPLSSVEEAAHSSGSSKEKAAASVAETETEAEEEAAAAGMEPKPTPEEVFKARRSEAIKAKALEIETQYRKDCETFRTVVKMLVTKEPSLDNLLQAPLDQNLVEIKERCLDALRQFVKELDEILKQPDASA